MQSGGGPRLHHVKHGHPSVASMSVPRSGCVRMRTPEEPTRYRHWVVGCGSLQILSPRACWGLHHDIRESGGLAEPASEFTPPWPELDVDNRRCTRQTPYIAFQARIGLTPFAPVCGSGYRSDTRVRVAAPASLGPEHLTSVLASEQPSGSSLPGVDADSSTHRRSPDASEAAFIVSRPAWWLA